MDTDAHMLNHTGTHTHAHTQRHTHELAYVQKRDRYEAPQSIAVLHFIAAVPKDFVRPFGGLRAEARPCVRMPYVFIRGFTRGVGAPYFLIARTSMPVRGIRAL